MSADKRLGKLNIVDAVLASHDLRLELCDLSLAPRGGGLRRLDDLSSRLSHFFSIWNHTALASLVSKISA